jgi:DNA-binding beta-propeller fold protein YncE
VTGNQVVVGYDLANAAYDSVSFYINEDALPIGLRFNNDGTKLYVLGNGTKTVYQYTLSTAFDLSTASYDSVSFSISSQDSLPYGMVFSPDGTKMYMVGATTDSIYQYTLSTAFDLSTASYDSVSFSVGSQDTSPLGVAFNNDGTKMYVAGNTNDSVFQYSLSPGYDLSTASYDSVSFSISSQDTSPHDIVFNTDGTKMYMIGTTNDSIFQYTLSTAFDLSTASYDSVSFSISSQDTSPSGMAFNNDGTKLYMVGYVNDRIFQYTTATSTAITITWDSSIKWAGGTAPDSPANGEKDLYTITTDDAGTSYVGIQSGDNFS